MKKYQWCSEELKNRYNKLWKFILGIMGIELILYFLLHIQSNNQMTFYYIGIPVGLVGIVLWWLSYRIQQRDRDLWSKVERDREEDV